MAKKHQTYFTKEHLRNQIFNVGKHEHKVFMPNEFFDELKGYENEDGQYIEGFLDVEGNKVKGFKSSTHIAYAYAYVYLSHFMYRYCKYYTRWEDTIEDRKDIDEEMIKMILGFPSESDTYTYITKKNGILNRLGYIRKHSDKPIEAIMIDNYVNGKKVWQIDDFLMEGNYPDIYGNSKNRKINFPIKAFFREKWAEEECVFNGTFWDIEDTHMVDVEVFIYCMSDKDLGVEGFYLYCFLLFKNDKFKSGFTCSLKKLVSLTGLTIDIIKKQLKILEIRNMITNNHMAYCYDRPQGMITKANTYQINDVRNFANSFIEWNVIPKQRKLSAAQYESEVGFVNSIDSNDDSGGEDAINLDNLPF